MPAFLTLMLRALIFMAHHSFQCLPQPQAQTALCLDCYPVGHGSAPLCERTTDFGL